MVVNSVFYVCSLIPLNHADSLISIIPLSALHNEIIVCVLTLCWIKHWNIQCIVNSYLKRHIYKTSFYNTYPIRAHTQCGLVQSRFKWYKIVLLGINDWKSIHRHNTINCAICKAYTVSNQEKMNYYDCIDNKYNCTKTCPWHAKG